MKVKVTVLTTMEYTAVIDAVDEISAVQQAMLDALNVEDQTYSGQTSEWEVITG